MGFPFADLREVMIPEIRQRHVAAILEHVVVSGDQELDLAVKLADLAEPPMEKAS